MSAFSWSKQDALQLCPLYLRLVNAVLCEEAGRCMGEVERLTALDLGNPTMRVYSGMTATVAAEKTASGPSTARAGWQLPAQPLCHDLPALALCSR